MRELDIDGIILNMRGANSRILGRALTGKKGGSASGDDLKKACADFEAIFLQEVFKAMRRTVPDGGLFPSSLSREIFEGFLDEAISRESAKRNEVGLARLLYHQLKGRDGKE